MAGYIASYGNPRPKGIKISIPERSAGTNDYNSLLNKPQINGVTVEGNLTLQDLGIVSDVSYVYKQLSASSVWSVKHNLGKYPSVTVADSAGTVVVGEVNYVNENELTITFSAQFSGVAYLN